MPVSSTARGMRNYVPRRPYMTIDDVVTPENRMQQAKMLEDARRDKEDEMGRGRYNKIQDAAMQGMKKGGAVKKYAKGGMIDGCAQRGKTKGKYL